MTGTQTGTIPPGNGHGGNGHGGNGDAPRGGDHNLKLPVYMDYQATTPVDPQVLEAMLPWFTGKFGNPHSVSHSLGREAEMATGAARAEVAALVGAEPRSIVFTSGATESNNIAIKGAMRFHRDRRQRLVTVATEHKCVLDTARHLELEGFEVIILPVDREGMIDLDQLREAAATATLVSVMGVNNEIGVIHPLAEIGAICRETGALFHTDAAQAIPAMPIDVEAMNIDLMSISGHKICGPKGIGALYVRRRPRVRLEPLFSGGGQERGIRPGTLPTPLCVGLGKACALIAAGGEEERQRVGALTARLRKALLEDIPGVCLNGHPDRRAPGNLNVSFSCIEGESLMMGIPELAVASGSACTSASLEPSHVLRAIGVDETMAHTSIRFSLGRFTTGAEVDLAIQVIGNAVRRLRDMSPLWEMVQQGIDLHSIEWAGH